MTEVPQGRRSEMTSELFPEFGMCWGQSLGLQWQLQQFLLPDQSCAPFQVCSWSCSGDPRWTPLPHPHFCKGQPGMYKDTIKEKISALWSICSSVLCDFSGFPPRLLTRKAAIPPFLGTWSRTGLLIQCCVFLCVCLELKITWTLWWRWLPVAVFLENDQ